LIKVVTRAVQQRQRWNDEDRSTEAKEATEGAADKADERNLKELYNGPLQVRAT
jgi:hypothetical protein